MLYKTLRDYVVEDWGNVRERLTFIEVEGLQFYLRLVRGYLLFRLTEETADYTSSCFNFLIQPNTNATDDDLRSCFLQNWRDETVGRLLILLETSNSNSKWLVGFDRRKLWFASEQGNYPTWSLHTNPLSIEAKQLWTQPREELIQLILPDWEDERSNIRRAVRWHQLPEMEKWWARLDWKMGSREELENLTRWMAHTAPELWKERDLWGINYMFYPDGSATIYNARARCICREPSEREMRLGTLFLKYNQARVQRPPQLSLITPKELYSIQQEVFIAMQFTPPSMHEILEARLNLSTWLNGKLTEDEIDSLFASA